MQTYDPNKQSPTWKLVRVTSSNAAAANVAAAKKHLEIADNDSTHDSQLTDAVQAAMEQIEHDTRHILSTTTFELCAENFETGQPIPIPVLPVTELIHVKYYDGDSNLIEVAKSVANLDRTGRRIVLAYEAEWPTIPTQTDAVVVRFTAGYTEANPMPRLIRQAMLLQVGKWFEDRDMMTNQSVTQHDQAYERIVRRLMRSSYP